MKSTSWVMWMAAVLAGCSLNSSTPQTAWGKKDVSMLDYRTDAGQCALIAVTMTTQGNGANTAGGISGQNSTVPQQGPAGSGVARGAGSGGSGQTSTNPAAGGPTYRDSASADFVNRAANQQRMAEQFKNHPDTIYVRTPRTVDVYIRRLRGSLGEFGRRHLQTVSGVGYRMAAPG